MKDRTFTILLTLVLSALLAAAPVAQGKDQWQREFRVDSGQKIELEMKDGGSLEVKGWDKDLVEIICIAGLNDIEDYDIKVKETRYGLFLRAELNDSSIESNNFTVKLMVPKEFDIETESGGGHISITLVTGEFRGKTAGGGISLINVTGEAHLSTGGGQIEILNSDLDGRVKSGGGGGLVRNVTGNLKATSGGGVVKYQNVRDRDGDLRVPSGLSAKGVTAETVVYATAGGQINIKKAPEGAKVKTGGGNVRVRNASRFVQAQTGGGDIEIEIKDGYVTATTGAGDIEVVVEEGLGNDRDGIDLKTGHGEITIILPADASVDFELDLAYTRNSSRNFEIDSDFDLDIEETQKWKKEHGSNYWKHIYGTATINGGNHLVKIKGVNGNIRIKKR